MKFKFVIVWDGSMMQPPEDDSVTTDTFDSNSEALDFFERNSPYIVLHRRLLTAQENTRH